MSSHGKIVWLILLVVMAVGIVAWQIFGEPGKLRTANRAIDAAEAACRQGGKQEFDRRMVEAALAIKELDWDDQPTAEATLSNRLILAGCKTGT